MGMIWQLQLLMELLKEPPQQFMVISIPGGPGATDLHSGGILCDAMALACGGTAFGVSGAIFREGHTFVLTHGVPATNAVGSLGFKMSYIQLPCGTTLGYTTTDL